MGIASNPMMKPLPRPLLIGGTGRSGTTILNRLLAQHPTIADVPEWRFVTDPDGILDFLTSLETWNPYKAHRQWQRLESLLRACERSDWLTRGFAALERAFPGMSRCLRPAYAGIGASRFCPSFGRLADELLEKLSVFGFQGWWIGTAWGERKQMVYVEPDRALALTACRQFLIDVMEEVLRLQKATVFLEKNTWNILVFSRYLELFPEARLIHIYRDPRDVVASFCQQTWMPSRPEDAARICRDLLQRWRLERECVPGCLILEISLEAIVAEPEACLRRICDFAEVPFVDTMLSIPLRKANQGRWQRDFDPATARSVAAILENELQHWGYLS